MLLGLWTWPSPSCHWALWYLTEKVQQDGYWAERNGTRGSMPLLWAVLNGKYPIVFKCCFGKILLKLILFANVAAWILAELHNKCFSLVCDVMDQFKFVKHNFPIYTSLHIYVSVYCPTDLVGGVFTSSPGDWGSIPGWVILKTQKIILEAILPNTQRYKVWIKGKMEQSRERSSTLSYTLV